MFNIELKLLNTILNQYDKFIIYQNYEGDLYNIMIKLMTNHNYL